MTYEPKGAQQTVIETDAPVAVVLGGAGTGKTTTAAAAAAAQLRASDAARAELRRAQLISAAKIALPAPTRVLFVSFSRTAAAQVIDRAGSVVGPLLDRIDVVTFDGFAWRVINDFGAGYGFPSPLRIISESESRVPGHPDGMRYRDLIPAAMRVLANPTVAGYYARRYSLVICDEFQDTDDEEWNFLEQIAVPARRILLGDSNQCIYADMKQIDPDRRVAEALALRGAVQIQLPPASHRDPSGVLPAAAEAARERRFDDVAIAEAVKQQRLLVTRTTAGSAFSEVADLVQAEREASRTVAVFTHSNAATSELSDALSAIGVRHEQVGLSEALGEALRAQLALLRFALGGRGGRRELAVFVASNHRRHAPLVDQIVNRSNEVFEQQLRTLAVELRGAATPFDPQRLGSIIAGAYAGLGKNRGQQAWVEAARRTCAAMSGMDGPDDLAGVEEQLELARHRSLIGDAGLRPHPVQVMNLHQTKGREADATILLLQDDEFHGYEGPPYPKLSRLLYVVMTRARERAHLAVPARVHPLWLPLVQACESAAPAR